MSFTPRPLCPRGKIPFVTIEAGWTSESVWMLWSGEGNFVVLAGIRPAIPLTLGLSLVTIPVTLRWPTARNLFTDKCSSSYTLRDIYL